MNSDQNQNNVKSSGDRVPFWERLALGVGQFSSMFAFTCVNTVGRTVFIMILGVNAAWVGVALTIPRLVDGFFDPLMGKISDNFRSRWGRRRPFIVIGAACMGFVFGLTWMVPQHWGDANKIIFFTVMQLIFYLCYSVFVVPYNALMYEMTPDYTERNRVMAYVTFFHKAGEFLYEWIIPVAAVVSSLFFLEQIPAGQKVEMNGIRVVTWLVGLLIITGFGVIPGLFVRERFAKKTEHQEKVKLLRTCKEVFVNRPFMILVTITFLNFVAGILASNIDHFVLTYYMEDGDIALGSYWKGLLSSGYAVVGIAFIPVITWVARKLGKSGCLYFVYGLTVIGGVMKWFIFTPGHHIFHIWKLPFDPILLIDPLLCGPMWVAVRLLLYSMIADVCDEDELAYGKRREGMYGAVFSWVEKTIYSLSMLTVGFSVGLSGFNAALGGDQTHTTFMVMRLLLAGAPTITALCAIVALRFYPITAARAAETRRRLEERRGRITLE